MLSAGYFILESASARTSKPEPKSESAVSRRCHRDSTSHDCMVRWGADTPRTDAVGTIPDRFGPRVLSGQSTRHGTLGGEPAPTTLQIHCLIRSPEQGRTSRAKLCAW